MQKEQKLEEFRNFRTSKRQKRRVNKERNKEVAKEKMFKLRIVYVRKTEMKKKQLSVQLKLKRQRLIEFEN